LVLSAIAQGFPSDLARVLRVAVRKIHDLVTAGKLICNDERLPTRSAYSGQKIELSHLYRNVIGVTIIAKGPGHATTTLFD
jgi:hypothetical protein